MQYCFQVCATASCRHELFFVQTDQRMVQCLRRFTTNPIKLYCPTKFISLGTLWCIWS